MVRSFPEHRVVQIIWRRFLHQVKLKESAANFEVNIHLLNLTVLLATAN